MRARDLLLQPVSAGDLIDRSLRLYRRHFSTLVAIVAVPGLVAVGGGLLVAISGPDFRMALAGYMMTYGGAQILNLMIIGGLAKVISDHLMVGEPISFLRTWRVILRHWSQLVTTATIGWLFLPLTLLILGGGGGIMVGLLTLFFIPSLIGQTPSWFTILPFAILVTTIVLLGGLVFLGVYARVVMMPPAAIMERQLGGAAISRGLQLGARTIPKILAVLSIEYCLMWSIATALGVPIIVYAAMQGISLGPNSPETIAMTFNVLAQFGSLLSAPVGAVAFALLYFDNRVRKEGLDIEILAEEINRASETGTAPASPLLREGLS